MAPGAIRGQGTARRTPKAAPRKGLLAVSAVPHAGSAVWPHERALRTAPRPSVRVLDRFDGPEYNGSRLERTRLALAGCAP